MTQQPALRVTNLKKIYRSKPDFVAVDGISFDLQPGEILGLLGANGAGKTTTIQMLLSTLKPSSGSIVYFGKDFYSHRSEVLKKVAFASTYVSLPYNLSVRQNLEVFGRFYGLTSTEIRKRSQVLLERFGIEAKIKSRVSDLSAGQITRLMLVKAFMVRPKVALLDEPTASLDPDIAKEVVDFVFEQREQFGTAMLYTSHNMAEVSEVCDRVLFMKEGKIVADDIPKKLAKSVLPSSLKLLLANGVKKAIKIASEMQILHKTEHNAILFELDELKIAAFLTKLAKAGVEYTHIEIKEPSLEDYFLHMAGRRVRK